jgi:hypothetical protein
MESKLHPHQAKQMALETVSILLANSNTELLHTVVKNILGNSSYLNCGHSPSRTAKSAMPPNEYEESKGYHDLWVSRSASNIEIGCVVDGPYSICSIQHFSMLKTVHRLH